jgi:hypothetical protein
MRWFRLRQRWGSCLALVALVLQLAIAFGHLHLDHAPHAGDATIAVTAGNAPEAPSTPEAPDRDHCPTCALIHQAKALLTPDAPDLPLPVALDLPSISSHAAGLTASPPALFQARAPPIA